MSKFDKFLKKASQQVSSNLERLEGKFEEFKTTASQHIQNYSTNGEWTAEDLVPQNFPVDMPTRIDINGAAYRPVKLLDEGGFSFVFIAKNMETGQDFALKRLLIQEREMLDSAMSEIKYMEKLNGHDNIIKLVGYKQISKGDQTELYILMELAEDNLISILQKKADYNERFKEDELLKIFLAVCKAVAHLHAQSPPIIHRDLKVENVLVANGEYKLCDFGSCTTTVYHLQDKSEKARAEEDIQKNTTMAYWSPEMADLYSGFTIDEKSDVWALGCVLYKMCYFVGPFENASTLQIINCKYRIPDSFYSSEITDLIKYLLNPDPTKRPSVFDVVQRIATMLKVDVKVEKPAPRQKQSQQMAPRQMAPRQQPRQTQVRSTPQKQQPSSSSGGGDLFSMLDWMDNSGGAVQSSASPTTKRSTPSNSFDNAFGDDEDWSADFSEFESNSNSSPSVQMQQANVKPQPTKQFHVRQPSNSSQSGSPLFDQLDWQSSSTSIRPPSPQTPSKTSSHSRTSSASVDFTVDNLFQSQENTFTTAIKPLNLSKKRTWVIKATSAVAAQPKHKYVKRIALDLWDSSLLEYLLLLRARPLLSNEVVCSKTLVLLHHALQNGSTQTMKCMRDNLTFLTDIKDTWSAARSTDQGFARLIVLYVSYLIDRLSFGRVHPAFEPNFSLEKYIKSTGDVSPLLGSTTPFNASALNGLCDLLQALLEVQKMSLSDMSNPCKHGCVIPLVYDAEDISSSFVYLSKRISKNIKPNELNQVVSKFNTQYSTMMRFFSQVEKFGPLAAIAKLPQFPVNPPSIFSPSNIEPPKSTPPPPSFLRGNKPKQDFDVDGYESEFDEFESIDSENTIAVDIASIGEVSIKRITAQPGNGICADCPVKDPRYAVTNLGILICDPCYSVHRTLGEQISKSQLLDDNLSTEQMRFMESVGNERSNKFWEATLVDPQMKPNNPSNTQALNTFIRSKYLGRRFAPQSALRIPQMPRNLSGQNLQQMNRPPMQANFASPSRSKSFDANLAAQSYNQISPPVQQQQMNPQLMQRQFQQPQHQRVSSNGSPTLDNLNVFQQFK